MGAAAYKIDHQKPQANWRAYLQLWRYVTGDEKEKWNCPDDGRKRIETNNAYTAKALLLNRKALGRCVAQVNGLDEELGAIKQDAIEKAKKEKEELKKDDPTEEEKRNKALEKRLRVLGSSDTEIDIGSGLGLAKAGAQFDRWMKAHRAVVSRAAKADAIRSKGALYGSWSVKA